MFYDSFKISLIFVILFYNQNHDHNILKLLDILKIFLSPQVKESVIISNKYGIYELPHELSND